MRGGSGQRVCVLLRERKRVEVRREAGIRIRPCMDKDYILVTEVYVQYRSVVYKLEVIILTAKGSKR